MKSKKPIIEWTAIIVALLSMLLSSYGEYMHNDKAIEHRLTAMEKQQENDQPRLRRMEDKLDQLLGWAMGPK